MYYQDVLLKLKLASAGAFNRPAPLFWFFAAAVAAPFSLLIFGGSGSNNFPWYFWAMMSLLLLVVISVGFWMFVRESRHGQDISIRPKSY